MRGASQEGFLDRINRIDRIKKGARRLNCIAGARRKVYHCPDCGAEIAFTDIDVRSDTMHCRSCGKRHSLKRQIQRDMAKRDLGEPPPGIKVRPAVVERGGAWSDLVLCPRRNLAMMLLCLWLGGITGYSIASCATHGDWAWAVLIAPFFMLGIFGLVFEIFGKRVLHLYAERGCYTVGLWRFQRNVEFALTSETYAFVDEHPETGLINQGMPVREICVETKGRSNTVFGRYLPSPVQEFFCACIARRAAGFPLGKVDGGRRGLGIKHPIAFGVLSIAVLWCFAYAFSESERIVVSDGKLVIVESQWWGRKVERTEIPIKDITYVELVMGGGGRTSNKHSHKLEIQGSGGRVLKRLTGYGREVSGYQIGLMEAIRCRPGTAFERERLPNLSTVFVGIFLLMPMALACSGLELAPTTRKAYGQSC